MHYDAKPGLGGSLQRGDTCEEHGARMATGDTERASEIAGEMEVHGLRFTSSITEASKGTVRSALQRQPVAYHRKVMSEVATKPGENFRRVK